MHKATILICLAALATGVQAADKCLTASSVLVEAEAVEAAAAPKLPLSSVRLVASHARGGPLASAAGAAATPAASAFGSGDKMAFDTDVASGYFTTSVEKNKPYWTIKIQFKVATAMNSLVLGSELEHPLNIPGKSWVKWMANTLATRVQGPGSSIDLTGKEPYSFFPVMNVATAVAVDDVETPLIGSAVSYNLPGGRAFWKSWSNRQNVLFETGKHYTIVILERIDFENYAPWYVKNLDAVNVLDGQPVQFMLADAATDTTFFKFDLWNPKVAKAYTSKHCTK